MDVNASSLLGQQLALSQLQMGQSMLKASLKADQQVATILAEAVEATAATGNGRGANLDILV